MTVNSWIKQLVKLYKKIVKDANIPVENLDKANEAILECIEKLRPLAEKEDVSTRTSS